MDLVCFCYPISHNAENERRPSGVRSTARTSGCPAGTHDPISPMAAGLHSDCATLSLHCITHSSYARPHRPRAASVQLCCSGSYGGRAAPHACSCQGRKTGTCTAPFDAECGCQTVWRSSSGCCGADRRQCSGKRQGKTVSPLCGSQQHLVRLLVTTRLSPSWLIRGRRAISHPPADAGSRVPDIRPHFQGHC